MPLRDEHPPSRAADPMATPPESDNPTTAMLKADIDSGKTGDKVAVFDPGLSALGTDDEAAGRPPEPHRIRLARQLEDVKRWAKGTRAKGFSFEADGAQFAFLGVIVVIGVVLVSGIVLVS